VINSRSELPASTVQVAGASATSTEVGCPGVVSTRTGATSRRGRVAWPAVTCHSERKSTVSGPVEVTVRVSRGAPTMAVCCAKGGLSKAADCPGRAASWYAAAPTPSPPSDGIAVTDAG
jgi:hypothetical protein